MPQEPQIISIGCQTILSIAVDHTGKHTLIISKLPVAFDVNSKEPSQPLPSFCSHLRTLVKLLEISNLKNI